MAVTVPRRYYAESNLTRDPAVAGVFVWWECGLKLDGWITTTILSIKTDKSALLASFK